MKYKVTLSIFCLLWLLFMLYSNVFNLKSNVFIGVIWEIITLPVLFLVVAQLIVYPILWKKEKWKKTETFYALLISIFSATIVGFFVLTEK